MSNHDWHVSNNSTCQAVAQTEEEQSPVSPYRLYRFLTQLDDILLAEADDEARLTKIRPLVRSFLNESPWMMMQCPAPDPKRGWSVSKLYDDVDYPLTIQLVSWNPGMLSSIHNHGAWGLVAILDGEERNRFWHPQAAGQPMVKTQETVLQPGELITFMPNGIHQVEALGNEPVLSFNLYGETDYKARFTYDAETSKASPF